MVVDKYNTLPNNVIESTSLNQFKYREDDYFKKAIDGQIIAMGFNNSDSNALPNPDKLYLNIILS